MIRISHLEKLKQAGDKITMMTCYDACFAQLQANAGIEVLLVGDSLGMVLQGKTDTLSVSHQHMCYHVECVTQGLDRTESNSTRPMVIADMPFLTDLEPTSCALHAGQLMQAGANMVKLEGGTAQIANIQQLYAHGIPVCGHLGLTPQFVHQLSGYRVQGKTPEAAAALVKTAKALTTAGIQLLVLECVPSPVARTIASELPIPVIGIGAGADCDGQVLVLHDALGLSPGKRAKFVHNFLAEQPDVPTALSAYVKAVKSSTFPGPEHSYDTDL